MVPASDRGSIPRDSVGWRPAPTTPTVDPKVPRLFRLVGLVLLAVSLSACQLRLATDVRVAADGSGTLGLTVALDEELHESLTADGFDPFADLATLPEPWTATVTEDGRTLELTTTFADPAELTARVADLQAGLDTDDPAILDDVTLTAADDGRLTFTGRAGLRPPTSTGIDGAGVTFDGDALAALLAEQDDLVRYDLRVVFPGPVVDSDADQVDGRAATWALPVTDLRTVRAVADPPGDRLPWILLGAVVLGGAMFGLVVTLALRRRRA
jgi:hypothetical protein